MDERPLKEPRSLEWAIEAVLTAGVLVSGAMLLLGLVLDRAPLLTIGVVLLIGTPVSRVVVLTAGLLYRRDWLFAFISLIVLGVLGSSAWVAMWVERPRAAERPGRGANLPAAVPSPYVGRDGVGLDE